jgi:hypothetical protein
VLFLIFCAKKASAKKQDGFLLLFRDSKTSRPFLLFSLQPSAFGRGRARSLVMAKSASTPKGKRKPKGSFTSPRVAKAGWTALQNKRVIRDNAVKQAAHLAAENLRGIKTFTADAVNNALDEDARESLANFVNQCLMNQGARVPLGDPWRFLTRRDQANADATDEETFQKRVWNFLKARKRGEVRSVPVPANGFVPSPEPAPHPEGMPSQPATHDDPQAGAATRGKRPRKPAHETLVDKAKAITKLAEQLRQLNARQSDFHQKNVAIGLRRVAAAVGLEMSAKQI